MMKVVAPSPYKPLYEPPKVDISKSPPTIENSVELLKKIYTLGDLHGNLFSLLLALQLFGLMKLENNNTHQELYQLAILYQKLFACENVKDIEQLEKSDDNFLINHQQFKEKFLRAGNVELEEEALTKKFLLLKKQCAQAEVIKEYFLAELNKASFAGNDYLIRLIGDILADRFWWSDDFMLELLKQIVISGGKLEILASNHDMEFLYAFFNDFSSSAPNTAQYRTLNQLFLKIKNDDQYKQKIKELVEKYFIPNLKALSYDFVRDSEGKITGISLFTHAPVPFSIIKKLADAYGVEYNDKTPEQLAATIDAINIAFRAQLNKDFLNNIYSKQLRGIDSGNGNFAEKHPLVQLCWQRYWSLYNESDQINPLRPAQHPEYGYLMFFTNGHDSKLTQKQIENSLRPQLESFYEACGISQEPTDEQFNFFLEADAWTLSNSIYNAFYKKISENQIEKFMDEVFPALEKKAFEMQYEEKNKHTQCLDGDVGYSEGSKVMTTGKLQVLVQAQPQQPKLVVEEVKSKDEKDEILKSPSTEISTTAVHEENKFKVEPTPQESESSTTSEPPQLIIRTRTPENELKRNRMIQQDKKPRVKTRSEIIKEYNDLSQSVNYGKSMFFQEHNKWDQKEKYAEVKKLAPPKFEFKKFHENQLKTVRCK